VTTGSPTSGGTDGMNDDGESGVDSLGASSSGGESDPGTGTGGTGNTGEEGDSTGSTPPAVCMGPRDCVLVNDCCQCAAVHADEVIDECPIDCKTPMCDALGIPDIELVCEQDECSLDRRNCADGLVTCDGPTPECPEGTLPEVTPEGDCWTGACIPVEACDGVPGCEFCDEDEVCVEVQTQQGATYRCDPVPQACGGMPTCACLPQDTCEEPFGTCEDVESGIACTCPQC
jgi:hypothetical protein